MRTHMFFQRPSTHYNTISNGVNISRITALPTPKSPPKRGLFKFMGIGGVIAASAIAGVTISSFLGAAISSLVKGLAAEKLIDLFKKDEKRCRYINS